MRNFIIKKIDQLLSFIKDIQEEYEYQTNIKDLLKKEDIAIRKNNEIIAKETKRQDKIEKQWLN